MALLLLKKLKLDKILDVFKFIDYKFFFRKNKIHFQKKIVSKIKNNKEITISKILNNYKKKGVKFFLNTFNSLYLFDSKNKELSNTNDDYILLEI